MNRSEKGELVGSLKNIFEGAKLVVVTHQQGLSVAEVTDLRARMRDAGAGFKVTKNRLTRLALDGSKFAHLTDFFKGPTAIAYSADPVAAAKVAAKFAKENDKLVILGGALDEQTLDASGVSALAELPSLDELRGKIVGMIATPATRLATLAQAPASQVARVLSAYAQQGEAA
ncbi:MAG: 50S ribosomal protein L10 [Alphaproteobacteria bacterium]